MHNIPHSKESKLKISESHKRKGTKPPSRLGQKMPLSAIIARVEKTKGKKRKMSESWRKNSMLANKKRIGKPNPKNSGSNSNFWRGGVSGIHDLIRHSAEYRLWRDSVFQRDKYTCIFCGAHSSKGLGKRVVLHPDHIKPFAYFPELRFAIDNGRTLCIDC